MDKKPYFAPNVTIVLPEMEDLMIGIGEGSAIEVLTNDLGLNFEDNNPDNPESPFNKDKDKLWDSF